MMLPKELLGLSGSAVCIILMGIVLGKLKILPENASKTIGVFSLQVCLPAMILKSFIIPIDEQQIKTSLFFMLWSFVFFPLMVSLIPFLFFRYEKSDRWPMAFASIFGAGISFSTPFIYELYGPLPVIYAHMFNLAPRTFGNIIIQTKLSGDSFSPKILVKNLCSPVVLSTLVGLFLWLGQEWMPQVNGASILRLDVNAYWLYRPLDMLAAMLGPLVWAAAGLSLAEINWRDSFLIKGGFFQAAVKTIGMPLINLALLFALKTVHINPGFYGFAVTTLMLAAPCSNNVMGYSLRFDRSINLVSMATLISNILGIVGIISWIFILELWRPMLS